LIVSLALDIGTAPPRITHAGYVGAARLKSLDYRHGAEREWLELLAGLFSEPPGALPCEEIARMLRRTFRSQVCCYVHTADAPAVGGVFWPGDSTETRAVLMGDDIPQLTYLHHLSLAATAPFAAEVTFVLGRHGAYGSAERRLAATLAALIDALNVLIHEGTATAPHRAEPISLTAREQAVLALLGDGLTAVAIAHRLRISSRTVHKHLERTYRKLDVTDRLAAVMVARRLGLLPR
jgi:DNA-binding CsgD family transcriptional regulator